METGIARNEIVSELNYVQQTLQRMSETLTNYISQERNYRASEKPMEPMSYKDTPKNIAVGVVATLIAFNFIVELITGGIEAGLTSVAMGLGWCALLLFACKRRIKIKGKLGVFLWMVLIATGGILLFWVFNLIVTGLKSPALIDKIIIVFMLVVGFVSVFMYIKFKKRHIVAYNRQVAEKNNQIAENNYNVSVRREALQQRYQQLQYELLENTSGWYPPDYYNLAAVEFFIHAIRNGRASNVKEMVNLFEETQYKNEMLEHQRYQSQRLNDLVNSQQAIHTQLRYSNMLTAMGNIQLASIGSNIRDNTQATNNLRRAVGR